jgi:hypothetical protein
MSLLPHDNTDGDRPLHSTPLRRQPIERKTQRPKVHRRQPHQCKAHIHRSYEQEQTRESARFTSGRIPPAQESAAFGEVDEHLSSLLDHAGVPGELQARYIQDLLSIINPVLDWYFDELAGPQNPRKEQSL